VVSEVVVVRGRHVLTMGPDGDLEDAAVAVAGGEILAVGAFAELAARFPDAQVTGDGSGVVLPGLVNAHTHLSEALIPGMGEDQTLFEWLERIVAPVGRHLTREMARVGAMLKGAELLLSGVTCVNDMFCHNSAGSLASLGAVDGLEAIGLRAVVSFGAEDSAEADRHPVRVFMDEHEALAERCAATALIGFRLGVGTVLGQTDGLLAASAKAAREHGWAVHTHLAEVREEVVESRLRWGRTTVEQAAEVGLFDVPVIAGHGIWVSEPEVDLLAGAGVAVAHNPVANMILGSGVCRVAGLRRAGVAVGIGTDGPASNDSQNMLEAVKTAALLQKVARLDPRALSAGDVLTMATVEGARALGLDGLVGSLQPGRRADLVRLRGDRPGLANVHDPRQQVVYCAGPTDVADVWVDGRRRVADGQLVDHDLAALVEASRPLAAELATEAGLAGLSRLASPARGGSG
jgi:cytosine/adenosine deaminase-related metal-dependent hydrolase